jgi:hypothetical protein
MDDALQVGRARLDPGVDQNRQAVAVQRQELFPPARISQRNKAELDPMAVHLQQQLEVTDMQLLPLDLPLHPFNPFHHHCPPLLLRELQRDFLIQPG